MLHVIQELLLTRSARLRASLIGALSVALLLSGCGRKAGLDPPPSGRAGLLPAWSTPAPAAGAEPVDPNAPAGAPVRPPRRDFDEQGRPIAPPGEKKRFFLDWLLD